LLKIKKDVKIQEVLHGFDFNYKKRSAADKLLERFHHHQLFNDNILTAFLHNTLSFFVNLKII